VAQVREIVCMVSTITYVLVVCMARSEKVLQAISEVLKFNFYGNRSVFGKFNMKESAESKFK